MTGKVVMSNEADRYQPKLLGTTPLITDSAQNVNWLQLVQPGVKDDGVCTDFFLLFSMYEAHDVTAEK